MWPSNRSQQRSQAGLAWLSDSLTLVTLLNEDWIANRDAIVMNELTQMADRRPQEVVNVLRAWLAEQKQPAGRK